MNVIVYQSDIVWENPEANFHRIEDALAALSPAADSLLVLPEMYSTGFSFALDEVGEGPAGVSTDFLKKTAKRWKIAVVGSFPFRDSPEKKGRNRLLCAGPDGELLCQYDKIHPFSYGKEAEFFEGGNELPIFRFQEWNICPTICYDLRFPELYRRACLEGQAELFLCIANWPSPRREHWKTLVRARAIENQACMVAVNRVGKDPLNEYSGDSVILNAKGEDLMSGAQREGLFQFDLDKNDLLKWRKRFPALADATDEFRIADPS